MELEFYTIDEIADILKICNENARKLCNTKGFPSIKFGRTIRIPKAAFEKWVDTYTGREFMV